MAELESGGRKVVQSRLWGVKVRRPGERRSLSRSATRALDVLEYFGQLRRPLRAVEISKALELHPSSTNQLLKTMVEAGHVTFDARNKSYLPSHRLALFGAWIVESYGGDERLRALVRDLAAAAGEVVTLTTPNDLFMQIIDVAGMGPLQRPTERGLRVSVFGTAVGAAYLSSLADAEIARLARRARAAQAKIAEMLASVAEIRRDGFAEGANEGSVWSIAAPLPATRSPVPLVLGLAGPQERVQRNRAKILELMRAAIASWADQPPKAGPNSGAG
jgi:DNA-binding IclR family transcriptional regulator